MRSNPREEEIPSQVERTTLEQVSDGNAADTCVICLNSLVEQCEALPCKHDNFDYICLVTWLQTRARCPLCNSPVQQVRYDSNDADKNGKFHDVLPSFDSPDHQHPDASIRLSPSSEPRNESLLRRRRFVYRHNLYSAHVGSNKRQTAGLRYRELSPELFATDPLLVARARDWLRRELQIFEFLTANSAAPRRNAFAHRPSKTEFLVEYIIAILKTLDTQGSQGQAEEMIKEFLGRTFTQLFLHELRAWLRSPYRTLSEWDLTVKYGSGNVPGGNENPTDFENSGAATPGMVTQAESSTIILKYHELPEARKPPPNDQWYLLIIKGEATIDTIQLSTRTCWLMGRETAVVDLEVKHPSVSKQHAVIQFLCRQERDQLGAKVSKIKPYLTDLDGVNGTTLNSKRVPARQYLELRNKDTITFGSSTREYILINKG
ncbi:hypothetical protein O1611_g1422 [Lasiodiplodia mahajangana]|uniref:Uncharacterized protein n=1 Tax=Lasiodiplodia mahajangana TaxID=1108764 RepID=A0ACC2JXM9_9PEZI|nr:hypothetical protein O1611_g1422 [Lasiodiplodia mahajangana]